MPPEIEYNNKPFSNDWKKTVKVLKKKGIYLPDHYRKGLIFSLDNSGKVNQHAPFSIELLISPKLEYPEIEWKSKDEESVIYETAGMGMVPENIQLDDESDKFYENHPYPGDIGEPDMDFDVDADGYGE